VKILLLNDNPVVSKLVTLSAQKTSNELDVVDSVDSIQSGVYDLLVVDDAMYNDDIFSEIERKITFTKSLYICSRDAAKVEAFSSTLKKPFLPTDLVELFLKFSKEVNASSLSKEETATNLDELEEFTTEELIPDEKVTEQSDSGEFEDIDLSLDDELSLEDDELSLEDDELSLEDDELSFDEKDLEVGDSVLDDEEAQKVKDLLDETSDEELGLELETEEDLALDEKLALDKEVKSESSSKEEEVANFDEFEELSDEELEFENELMFDEEEAESEIDKAVTEELALEEEVKSESSSEEEEEEVANLDELEELSDEELEFDNELMFDEEEAESEIDKAVTEELALEEELTLEESEEELDLETQIENAVEKLSDEDLESELDEETLLEIATNEIDSMDAFDSLTSNDLKLAIGEEVNTEIPEISSADTDLESFEETKQEANNNIEALESLLAVLKDKNIAASMKGKKININITIGDE